MRNSFVFYGSWWIAIKNLPRDIQGDVLTAIIEYGLTGVTTENPKPIAKAMLAMAKEQIDINHKRFENGKKGGRPNQTETKRKPNGNQTETKRKPNGNQTETKQKPNVNVNENENENENVVACATTRARSEVLSIDEIEKEIINAESKAETLQMLYRISKEDYESIRDEILAEWKFRDYANTLSDAMQHFVNLVRVKAKSLKHPPNVPAKELSGRQRDFWQQVQSFSEQYGEEMLKAFYAKWAEADASGKYMKWEFEDGFDIGKRLAKFHAYWTKT